MKTVIKKETNECDLENEHIEMHKSHDLPIGEKETMRQSSVNLRINRKNVNFYQTQENQMKPIDSQNNQFRV